MACFDDVRIKYPLPVGTGLLYQTYDLGCNLDVYEITEDGKLIRVEDWTPELFPHKSSRVNTFAEIWWFAEMITVSCKDDPWVEYNITFSDGRVSDVSEPRFRRK